ncbi:hypothetical protein FLAVO9AF_110103 [Flavobacterium sp. 9AF]|uniref:hypothetical protein n=1 Tax=Flavobacterium sp. 9AF TaxID=2653142 RepID=UPI0012F2AA8F|nr:hypothetical protein [Flavobacterium sp. 9AF]VXB14324.1 hypothetical protein FLAVO9AF_110103 [Flavobacterium sp. 9AF]
MNKLKLNPLRLLFIGMLVIFVGAIAKITGESFYKPILITGLVIEIISVILLLSRFNHLLKSNK